MGLAETIESLLTSIESHIYIGNFNDDYDNICIIYPTGGFPAEHCFGSSPLTVRHPTFQVRIRDTGYNSGYTRAEAVLAELSGYSSTGISIFALTDIFTIGKDDKNRSEFTINFECIIT